MYPGAPSLSQLLTKQAGLVNAQSAGFVNAPNPYMAGGRREPAPLFAGQFGAAPPPRYAAEEPPEEEDSAETIDLGYIIREKPKVKIVREFMRENLASIKGDDELLFAGAV